MQSLHNTTIKHVVERFQNKHTVERQRGSGWPFSVCTAANTEEAWELVQENHHTLVRKLAHCTGMSLISLHCTLRKIYLYPYHIAIRQQLYLNEFYLTASKPDLNLLLPQPRFFPCGVMSRIKSSNITLEQATSWRC